MSSPTTNPTPAEVLAAFRDLGMEPVPVWAVSSFHIRVLTARGLYLADHISTPDDQDEFDAIEQELAERMMGRVPLLK
jgi:hypothetical protein